jgi:hypothetical protein
MSKKKPQVRASRQQQKPYEPPIPWKRLDMMLRVLHYAEHHFSSSSAKINPDTLKEIAHALTYLKAIFFAEWSRHQRRGPPIVTKTWGAAVIVQELIDKHGATSVKAAANATWPDATTAELETLKHTYRMLKRGVGAGAKLGLVIRASLVEEAAARLRPRKSGHK